MKLKALKKTAPAESCELVDIYRVRVAERHLKIAVTRQRANKRIIVKCSDDAVVLRKYIPIAGGLSRPAEDVAAYISVAELLERDTACILVIAGKPLDIHGLDNGRIGSARAYCSDLDTQRLYVMSESAFENLEL